MMGHPILYSSADTLQSGSYPFFPPVNVAKYIAVPPLNFSCQAFQRRTELHIIVNIFTDKRIKPSVRQPGCLEPKRSPCSRTAHCAKQIN